MNVFLPLFLLLTSISVTNAQSTAGVLSVIDYKTIQIINTQYSQSISLGSIEHQPVNGSWSQLNTLGFGSPQCAVNEAGNNCYFRKPGIEIYYSDRLGKFMMGHMKITNADFVFKMKGQLIKVGDDISKLSSVHPEAYNKRQKVPSTANEYQVILHLEYTGMAISFRYDPQTNCITMIRVRQSLV